MTLAEDRSTGMARGKQPSLARYEDDLYTWALEQAERLRSGRLDHVDTRNVADEIATLTHYLADKLRSDLSRVLQNRLKWDYQPQMRSRSWVLSVREHRRRVARHLARSPGLQSALPNLLADAYAQGRDRALDETGLPEATLPHTCPYSWDDIMNRAVEWPEDA